MLPHKHTKEGVLNEKLALKKLLTYMKSVYKIPQKIKGLSDERKRKSIPLFNIVMPVLIFLMLQYESFHTIFSAPESMEKRLKNCIRGKIPKVDAVRDLLSRIDPKEIEEIHAQTVDIIKRNRVFREGNIGGYVVAGIDGVELFSSTKKSCPECLSRKNGAGKTEYFHRSVVCMTVGNVNQAPPDFALIFAGIGLCFCPVIMILVPHLPLAYRGVTFIVLMTVLNAPQCAVALCTVQILLNAAPEKNRSLLISLFTMMTTLTNSVLPLLGVRLYTALGADFTALYRFNLIDLGVRILSTLGLIWRYQKAKKDGFLTKISD